jgi:nicotinamidase-related amidase
VQALVVVDAQNEFGPGGQRMVPDHQTALEAILARVAEARAEGRPIAFIRHHNIGADVNAFVPGSWGAEFSPGIGPVDGVAHEAEFVKEVVGAFSTTHLESWLRARGCGSILLVGFFAHMCLSTSAREAYVRFFDVAVDPDGTASCSIHHPLLGEQSADEVRRTALLHLSSLGVAITPRVTTKASISAAGATSR